MQIEMKKLSELQPAEYNPRQASEKQFKELKASIEKFGFVDPVIVNKRNNRIVGGHFRIKVAKELGIEDIPCVFVDLSEEDEAELNIRLNKNNGSWDFDLLNSFDTDFLIDIGFDEKELSKEFDKFLEPEEDEAPEVDETKEPDSKLGEVYELGRHRLMCGDATKAEDVEKLMNGNKADMVFTDPPYALFGNSTGVAGITDDKMTRPFFLSIFNNARSVLKLFGHMYTCCDWHSAFSLQAMAKDANLTEKNLCIWDKGDGGIGGMYQQCYEMIWFHANSPLTTSTVGKKRTGERTVNGKPNIWRHKRADNTLHNAAKPVEMIVNAIKNSSDNDDIVLDLFGGSGSTLIAAEQTNRKCYMIELDPKYCDVIKKRYEQFAEKKRG